MLEWLECGIVGMVGKSEWCWSKRKSAWLGKLESQVVGIIRTVLELWNGLEMAI